MKRLLTVIVMVVVLVGVSVVGSIAGVKTIKPDELKPTTSTDAYVIFPDYARSDSPTFGTIFSAKVKLPVGKVVKKVTYYHRGYFGAYTYVMLKRSKMGENTEIISFVDSIDSSAAHVAVETTYARLAKIKSGYTYYIEVGSDNNNSFIEGIKITYK